MTAERYVTANELAELMGLSTRTIRRMTVDGMPNETWGMGRTRRYLPSQAIGWASARAKIAAVNTGRRANAGRANERRE
jgi:phage terminase Nu1 subunit (DNA packaging protein)